MSNIVKLKKGDKIASSPIMGLTGEGKTAYLWIGNNAKDNKACFATLSGQKTLEKFAKSILEKIKLKICIGHPKHSELHYL